MTAGPKVTHPIALKFLSWRKTTSRVMHLRSLDKRGWIKPVVYLKCPIVIKPMSQGVGGACFPTHTQLVV